MANYIPRHRYAAAPKFVPHHAMISAAPDHCFIIPAQLNIWYNATYGICVTSGQAIPKDRLRAIPWATERIEYKVGGLGRRH